MPSGAPSSRARELRAWLTRTFTGRALLLGAAIKFVAFVLSRIAGTSRGIDAFDAVGDVTLVVGTVALGYRLYVDARRRLLWRVRRKLIVSYIFIGFVPALLIIAFFLLSGTLLFLNVSAYMLRSRVAGLVDQTRFLAQTAALELQRAQTPSDVADTLARRQTAAVGRYPMASYALVPASRTCGRAATVRPSFSLEAAGPWTHTAPPSSVPAWVECADRASLIVYADGDRERLAARAVAWPEGAQNAVIVDIPFSDALTRELHDEMGITLGDLTTLEIFDDSGTVAEPPARKPRPQTQIIIGPVNVPINRDQQEPIGWVAFLDYTDWTTGEMNKVTVGFRIGPSAVYRYLSGPSLESINNFNLGQILLVLLAVVGGLFLIIQAVAFVMGLTLARSITGSVHELFAGTERVRRGDFTHKIAIRSRDQLGELAGSFNSMTASIEELLHQKAEKERLEQELRIARSIQMSLFPLASLSFPGIVLTGHCEPAREVGGDYYDFLPLDEWRIGILIADVAGKGTSAALYMAELKGLMLSLSELHASPRALLIVANRIISKHLDARSFITMTYAVVDLRARTLTMARAGHCPLVYVPGPHAASRTAQALTPDGMVLGLQFDTGDLFGKTLEEVTLPIDNGDLFLLYTDGISEAMNLAGDCFGDTRLADLAREHADLESGHLRDCILGEVRTFAGTAAQHDDMTMVLLKIEDR
ncbi:MAG TPA: SpoIIE family protein phosphatase [Vicinamibacterales bacterium]|nr:SpoIIE family protein phosphatase [Vicinamibacterales bacterium]